jgi:hypothetical protein
MANEWRIVQLAPMLTFEDSAKWIVSRRKLSDAEIDSIKLTHFRYDFSDELGISGDSCLIMGVVTLPGATRAQAIEERDRLNKGKNLFEDLFVYDEEDNDEK